jgi:hypothetical protein
MAEAQLDRNVFRTNNTITTITILKQSSFSKKKRIFEVYLTHIIKSQK